MYRCKWQGWNYIRTNPALLIQQQPLNIPLHEADFVKLKIFNILDYEIATLVNEYKPAGTHFVEFDSRSYSSNILSSVVFFTEWKPAILPKPKSLSCSNSIR